MRSFLIGFVPCALVAQGPPPITYEDILAKARTSPGQVRTEALLAERQRALAGSGGFLREGPSLAYSTGPRTRSGSSTTQDQNVDLDAPLFLSVGTRQRLVAALGQAEPLLRDATRVEAHFNLHRLYLDAWLAEHLVQLRERDIATVESWLKATQARVEAGADAAFQVNLVEGELLRAQADLDEAGRQRLMTWAELRSMADMPQSPVHVADPGDVPQAPRDTLQVKFQVSTLRRAIKARLDLEGENLRHQEALATSRWSLRGTYAREGDEHIGKVGLAYRFARPGEGQAVRRETEANLQATRRDLELALDELDARFQTGLSRLQGSAPPLPFSGFETALRAISLRLSEGKERPSEALPIRRQLLEAQAASYRRLHAAHLLVAELQALTTRVTP